MCIKNDVPHIDSSVWGTSIMRSACDYCRRNVTGSVKRTRTFLPRCLPGIHLGMACTARIASLSRAGSAARITFGSTIEPSLFTTN